MKKVNSIVKAKDSVMKTKVTDLLDIQYPIIQGGMAWVAEHLSLIHI